MSKAKSKLELEHSKMLTMLQALGMDESLGQMLKSDEETIKTAGAKWNQAFGDGQNALKIINDLKRDSHDDWQAMGVPSVDEMQWVETVEEYRERIPAFCIAEVILDFHLDIPGYPRRSFKQGQHICMTAMNYTQYNQLKPCLKPSSKYIFSDIYNPYRGQDLTGKTVCVWRAGGIGDLLFIRPIMMHLKEKYGCKIIFCTKAQYHPMAIHWDDAIDGLADIDFDVDSTLLEADYHITFEGVIERCLEAEQIDVHDLFAKLCGIDPDEVEWCRPMTMPEPESDFFKADNEKYVAVQMKSSASVRSPLMGTYRRLIDACTDNGYKVVVAEPGRNVRLVKELISVCDRQDMIIHFDEPLNEVVNLVDGASFVIAPDSALTHLAAMQDKPCLSLYGAFPSRVRTTHYPKCIALDTPPSDVCPYGGRECFIHASHGTCAHEFRCWEMFEDDIAVDCVTALVNASETADV